MTMTLISKLSRAFIILWCLFLGPSVAAQESVTLSISPTLFDMSGEPGQTWQSKLRVVNVNSFDLTVYVEVVNFAPRGEGGDGRFVPVTADMADGSTLAEWISVTKEAVVIPREQTSDIPFIVTIPKDAAPGGHFAAILIGTKPPKQDSGQSRLQTAQMVTSLFFTRVAGDVHEVGSIREFTTSKSYLGTPEVAFSLRFENKGNVHLRPQGEIKILNMWGEERGIVPINQYTNFGNVLPNSIRKFDFTWKGEWSMSDIGRYTAIATLGYGTEEKQFASSKTNFWVIPIKLLLGISLGLVVFFAVSTWLVRLYVRHMLQMAGISIENYRTVQQRPAKRLVSLSFKAPVQAGILDLKTQLRSSVTFKERCKTVLSFVRQYKLFFLGAALVLICIGVISLYLRAANTKHRAYEVIYESNEAKTAVTSEEILYDRLKAQSPMPSEASSDVSLPKVALINRSGVPGVGATIKLRLEQLGYQILTLEADFTSIQKRTIIVSPDSTADEALRLSKLLDNALVSVEENSDTATLTIYVGSDTEVK